jgi:hypothetical protein
MFLNLTLASGDTIPIIASGIFNPAFAYFPCSKALHVKYQLLPEDLITLPNIRRLAQRPPNILAIYSRNRNRLLCRQSLINTALYSHGGFCIVGNVQKAPCGSQYEFEKLLHSQKRNRSHTIYSHCQIH